MTLFYLHCSFTVQFLCICAHVWTVSEIQSFVFHLFLLLLNCDCSKSQTLPQILVVNDKQSANTISHLTARIKTIFISLNDKTGVSHKLEPHLFLRGQSAYENGVAKAVCWLSVSEYHFSRHGY